ncbi:MAG: hypothetical protein ABSA83_20160 [Verrucomicrobiota bacterium]
MLSAVPLAVAIGTEGVHAGGVTAKLAITINGRGSVSPNDKGKNLIIGQSYTIKAVPAAGFGFLDWIITGSTNTVTNTAAKMTFQMVSNLQLTANFLDVQPPTVKITTKAAQGSNSVVTISGTARDNVGVSGLWYQVGTSGWNLAATENDYTNWTAVVVLVPGQNTIKVYAEDAAGNTSLTNTVALTDDSIGLAPESIAGTTLQLTATNTNSAVLSFDWSTFSQIGGSNTSTGVGTYTYVPIGASAGQLATMLLAPPAVSSNDEVFTLFFTNGTSGTWTNIDTNSGTFTLGDASSSAPGSLSGLTLMNAASGSNIYQFTNEYGNGTFVATDTNGTSSGACSYALYSPTAALLQAIPTNAADLGTTNYLVLNFSNGSNTYFTETDMTNASADTNAGTFSVTGESSTQGDKAPVSLAGLSAIVTEIKTNGATKSFRISFGASSFSQFTPDTNHDSGVGTYIYTVTGTNTAEFLNTYLAPPGSVSDQGGPSPVFFTFTGSHSAKFSNADGHGTLTFAATASTVPLSLLGRTLHGNGKNGSGGISFTDGNFTMSGKSESGTYTYAIYGPQAAMVVMTDTDSTNAGTVKYLLLWYSSTKAGSFVQSQSSGESADSGTFTMK